MKIPLTKYGWPQVVVYPVVVIAAMVAVGLTGKSFLPTWAIISIETVLVLVLLWVLAFFRDPPRRCTAEPNLLLAPADGRITEIATINDSGFVDGPVLRIGIFLSIFNTHINRAPCSVRVESIAYKKGKYLNAMNPQSGKVNESNDLGLRRTESPKDKLLVRQVSGAIARRIVCKTSVGRELAGGEQFGMIKFGSRTELYLPVRENAKCLVQIGDKVKAGLTPLVEYEIRDEEDVEIES